MRQHLDRAALALALQPQAGEFEQRGQPHAAPAPQPDRRIEAATRAAQRPAQHRMLWQRAQFVQAEFERRAHAPVEPQPRRGPDAVRRRDDRRQRNLFLTEAGRQLEQELSAAQRRRMRGAFSSAGPEAVHGFRKVLEQMINAEQRDQVLRSLETSRP